ncbi:MAG: GNAT family N-acetyltransferase [Planctomycetes bacterium]|nr:GNAT family N-acetyltransferase [Planctomycetota bacterium]MCB9905157.1 GNAT family N-acetyltransferase [Planctomycetota bacterium]
MAVRIRALAESDDRAGFRSGNEALDLFFHQYAGQNQFRHHVGVTYVATESASEDESEQLLGFATVAPAALDADELPNGKSMPPYPIPVLRLARLATDERHRGRGVALALLRFTIELAEHQRDEVGCVGVLVDAKPESTAFYERFGFVPLDTLAGEILSAPRAISMFLPLGSVPRRTAPPA